MEREPAGVAIDGLEVRRRRKLRGESMSDFAGPCGISDSYLSLIETGQRRTVSPRVYAAICDVLGVQDRRELLADQGRVA